MTSQPDTATVSGTDLITVERNGAVLLIGLNRVEKRNALNPKMMDGLAQLEVARGIFPLAGTNWRFPERVGWGNAMRYLPTADELDAAEAMSHPVVPEDEALG